MFSLNRRLPPTILVTIPLLMGMGPLLRAEDDFQSTVQPLLQTFCFDCHANGERSGEVSFDARSNRSSIVEDQRLWARVRRVLKRHEMPPSDQEQLTDQQRRTIIEWIDAAVLHIDCSSPDPGRVTIRRLNRNEYRRTIRDLLGTEFDTSAEFPVDPSGHGFDNIGDVLSMPPLLMEKYLTAAEEISAATIVTPEDQQSRTRRYSLDLLEIGYNARQQGNGWVYLNSVEEDDLAAVDALAVGGEYKLRVRAYSEQMGERPIELTFLLGDRVLKTQQIEPGDPQAYECNVHGVAGRNRFRVAVRRIKDGLPAEKADMWKEGPLQQGAVYVEWLELEGPLQVSPEDFPEAHHRLFAVAAGIQDKSEAARAIFGKLLPRAYRRSVSPDEVNRVVAIAQGAWDRGANLETGIQDALTAVLLSPGFLYRAENVVQDSINDTIARLDDDALASRLSYFLWGTMPDDELFAEAQSGRLASAAEKSLIRQVQRMLEDPKAQSLVDDFAGQWLELRNLQLATPDPQRFPEFDEPLREAMRRESELLFQHVVQEDRSVIELLAADYTFVNERLARHYGLEGVEGDQFRRVDLSNSHRRGLLAHASILTLTSNPTRTSPVKRGKWVLENILGAPPPPPPANVPQLDDEQNVDQSLPLRARMAQHRRDPACANCHRRMDDIGFAFEHFDAIGAWRRHDAGDVIDAAGELYPGEPFSDSDALIELLAVAHREKFARCLAEKMLTYALGRGLEIYDECAIDQIVDKMRENDYRFSTLVIGIVESVPFQFTRVPASGAAAATASE